MIQAPTSTRADDTLPSTGPGVVADSDRDRIYRIAVAGLFGGDARRITERYDLRNRIGAGGLGVVYRAYDRTLERDVALKFLRRTSKQRSADLILREARTLARLSHPSVVPIFDLTTIGDEQVISMELIEGETLDQRIARGMDADELLRVMRGIADGLAAAHRAGVVHGDVKPGNVMIDRDGRVRLLDFGLARDVEQLATDETIASARGSHPSGTAGFLAPERFDDVVEPASDQFAFCVLLYIATFGRMPLPAVALRPSGAAIAAIDYRAAESGRRRVPGWLTSVIRRGLAERPRDRFASMAEVLDALHPPSRWPLALAGLAVAAATTATLVALRTDACTLSATAIDASLRAELVARAPDASREAIDASIDTFVDDWSASRSEACRTDDPRELAMHGACLDRAATAVDTALRRATDPSFDEWSVLAGAIGELAQVSACDDSDAVVDFSQDADPEIADAIQRGIDRAYTSLLFGDSAGYLEQLLEISERHGDIQRAPYATLWLACHLGRALTMRDRSVDATSVLRDALVEAARQPRWRRVEGTLHAHLAEAVAIEGDPDTAVFHARQAIAALGGSPRAAQDLRRAYFALALAELARADPGAAMAAIDEAARRTTASAHRDGIVAATGADDLALAISDAVLANLRGRALQDLGRAEEAEASFRAGLERLERLSPRHIVLAQISHNLGHLLATAGDIDAGCEMLERAYTLKAGLDLEASAAVSAIDLGNLEGARGRLEAALPWFERALAPGVPAELVADARFNRAIALQQLGRQADALADYSWVVARPASTHAALRRHYGARIGRGVALLANDRGDDARVDLEHARAIEPADAPDYDRAELRLALARAITDDAERATKLAREAQEIATAAGATALAEDAARWLGAQPR